MAKSQASLDIEEAEKSLEAIRETYNEWEADGSRVIDAPDAMNQVGEIIGDYFGVKEEEGVGGDEADGDEE